MIEVAGRVLLVEDDPDVGEVIADILRDAGYAVTCAATTAAGLDALASHPFDLVLADTLSGQWTVGSRWGALDRLRRAAGSTPVVICTAHDAREFDGYAERGFRGFLAKPFDVDELIALLETLLSNQHLSLDGQ